jgi:hypothetical protein
VRIVSPSQPLVVVSLNDPAFDRRSPRWPDACAEYLTARHPDQIAALPVVQGEAPARFTLAPLSVAALDWCRRAESPDVQRVRAFSCAVTSYTDADGHEHKPEKIVTTSDGFGEAVASWREHVAAEHGMSAVYELGAVAIQRAEVHPKALDPFVWPRGVALAR